MNEKILYDSPEAAKKMTLTGWVSKTGRYWGDNEHMARRDGCTHLTCECGNEHKKGWNICEQCRTQKSIDEYNKLEFKEWGGKQPLYSDARHEYFFDDSSIIDYCDEHECTADSLRLVLCEPTFARYIEDDYWGDELPDDLTLDDMAPHIGEAVDALNKLILESKPILSWFPGKFRTSITL